MRCVICASRPPNQTPSHTHTFCPSLSATNTHVTLQSPIGRAENQQMLVIWKENRSEATPLRVEGGNQRKEELWKERGGGVKKQKLLEQWLKKRQGGSFFLFLLLLNIYLFVEKEPGGRWEERHKRRIWLQVMPEPRRILMSWDSLMLENKLIIKWPNAPFSKQNTLIIVEVLYYSILCPWCSSCCNNRKTN